MRTTFSPLFKITLLAINLFPEKLKLVNGLPFTENVMLFFPTTCSTLASTLINLVETSIGLVFGLINFTFGRGNNDGL